jgi:hypothetical protein
MNVLCGQKARVRINGVGDMKPNHHWAVHTPNQLRDYGPVNNIWAFLSEHLNKILKGSNSNGRGGGQIEVSMMREFMRDSQLDTMVSLQFLLLRNVLTNLERSRLYLSNLIVLK